MTEEQIADEAMTLIRNGRVEEGASILVRRLSTRVQRYFERHRVPTDQAEELVSDTWLKIARSEFRGDTRAIVWIWTVAGSVLRDWVSMQAAERRGQGAEQGFGDSVWDLLAKTVAGDTPPAWVVLCVERAAHLFEQDHPGRSQVLRMCCEGWSAEEIAIHFGAKPPINDKHKTAARTRVYEATKLARGYFEHCKDET